MDEVSRIARILWVIIRYHLDALFYLVPPSARPWTLRLLLFFNPLRLIPVRKPLAERLRLALEELGPVFVKFGQLLSSRRDLLSDDFAEQLALLQDRMQPFTQNPRPLIEAALGQPLDEVFSQFEDEPIACASLAQVHGARLIQGESVIVKVLREGVLEVIQSDMKLLYRLARTVDRLIPESRRLHLIEIVRDYEKTLLAELNLRHEAANTLQLRYNFADSNLLYVPLVYESLCRQNLLVMERIQGVPIGQVEVLKRAGTNMKVLADRGVEIFFTQVFLHNFFHADMHPGNIFVDVQDPQQPRYIALDCAVIGILNQEHQDYLAQNLLAFFARNYRRVAELHIESGWVGLDTDVLALTAEIETVCEPIFQKPLREISFGILILSLFRAARKFRMEVQPELVLLQKTLLNIEGLGRQLYPDLDLWETAQPLLERWMFSRNPLLRFAENLNTHADALIEALPEWPALAATMNSRLKRLERRTLEQTRLQAELQQQQQDRARRLKGDRLLILMLILALGVCVSLLL